MIPRNEYLDSLIHLRDKQVIKVVTGIRRCGKSTLFELYQTYLLQNGVEPEQIIAFNLEDGDYGDIEESKALYDLVRTRLLPDRMNYIFLDEVQRLPAFRRAGHLTVRALYRNQDASPLIQRVCFRIPAGQQQRPAVPAVSSEQLFSLYTGTLPAKGYPAISGGHL